MMRALAPEDKAGPDLLGDDGGLAGDFETLAAAQVFARHHIVLAHHVRSEFREAGAVALVGAAGKLALFRAHHPGNLIFRRLVAVRTIQRSRFLFLLLVKKIALFHKYQSRARAVRLPTKYELLHISQGRRSKTPSEDRSGYTRGS